MPPEIGNLKGLKLLRFHYNRLGLELSTELLMLLDSRDEVEITPQHANSNVRCAFQARVLLLHETAVHFLFRQGFLVEPAVIDDSVDVVEPFQDLVGQEQGVQGEETVRSSPSSLSPNPPKI